MGAFDWLQGEDDGSFENDNVPSSSKKKRANFLVSWQTFRFSGTNLAPLLTTTIEQDIAAIMRQLLRLPSCASSPTRRIAGVAITLLHDWLCAECWWYFPQLTYRLCTLPLQTFWYHPPSGFSQTPSAHKSASSYLHKSNFRINILPPSSEHMSMTEEVT